MQVLPGGGGRPGLASRNASDVSCEMVQVVGAKHGKSDVGSGRDQLGVMNLLTKENRS